MSEIQNTVLAKLEQIETRYRQIEEQVSDPAVVKDPTRLVALSFDNRRIGDLLPDLTVPRIALLLSLLNISEPTRPS